MNKIFDLDIRQNKTAKLRGDKQSTTEHINNQDKGAWKELYNYLYSMKTIESVLAAG
jgi:hypothetical protein